MVLGTLAQGAPGPAPGPEAAPLEVRFARPPAETRLVKIIHNWPDSPEAQDALIGRLGVQGFGGVVCNVHFNGYLESQPKWDAFTRAVKAARQAGMVLWLYDEKGYPSATAGGLVLRDHPEWEATGLFVADAETGGRAVVLNLPPGKPVLAAAFPVADGRIQPARRVDLAGHIADRILTWQPPAGRWRVLAMTESRLFDGTHAELNLFAKMPYPNLLLAEPTAKFLELTHDRYARALGGDLGKWFVSTFTDEPSLMSVFLRRMPYRVLPWSASLAAEFERRRGYALAPGLPMLAADAAGGTGKMRYDYWRTIGELVSENYFGQIQRWCARHGVRSGGHLLAEENLVAHVPLYGDFFGCLRRMDVPSIDCLTSLPGDVPWHIARLAASAAELEGHALVMCETSDHAQRWRRQGDTRPVLAVTEDQIRGTCNRLMVGGVNRITSYYSFAGLSDAALRRLNEHAARCALLLTGGHHAADVAVVYPVESLWPRFRPARLWAQEAPEALGIEHAWRAVSDALFADRRDFTDVDGQALAAARPDGGSLAHGPHRWRAVVLAGADTLPLRAWEHLATLVRQGGILVAVGALPAHSEHEFPSPRVQAIARDLFAPSQGRPWITTHAAGGAAIYLPEGAVALLPGLLRKALEPGVHVSQPRAPIRSTHRRIDGHDVFLLINDVPEPWSGTVSVRAAGQGRQWNPATGEIRVLPGARNIPLALAGYGATLLRFPEARPARRGRLPNGALPGVVCRDLPAATPELAGGEFVRKELLRQGAPGAAAPAAWRARAVLTKADVDTHLFLRFPHPGGLDLTEAEMLMVESHVPGGQRTPNELLVILHEKDGSDYLARTGRSLGAPGTSQSFVPLSRFELAGWSRDENGRLDLAAVAEVRIGWGGYLGAADETVEFSVTRLQTVHGALF